MWPINYPQLGFCDTVAMVTMVEIDVYLHRNRGIEQLLRETEERRREEMKAGEMKMETGVVNIWLEL